MKNSVFLVFMMMLFSGLLAIHTQVERRLSPVKMLETKLSRAEKSKKESEFELQLADDRLKDFQQQVATMMPDALKDAKGAA